MSTAITRKEIIEDEAIKWGEDYVKMLQPAIEKNKEFVDSILALNEANKKLRASLKELKKGFAIATNKEPEAKRPTEK